MVETLPDDLLQRLMDSLPIRDVLACKTVATGWRQWTNARLEFEGKGCCERDYHAKIKAVTRPWQRTLLGCRSDVLQNLHISLQSSFEPRIMASETFYIACLSVLSIQFLDRRSWISLEARHASQPSIAYCTSHTSLLNFSSSLIVFPCYTNYTMYTLTLPTTWPSWPPWDS